MTFSGRRSPSVSQTPAMIDTEPVCHNLQCIFLTNVAPRQKMVSFDLVPLSLIPPHVEVRNLVSRERRRIRVKSEGTSGEIFEGSLIPMMILDIHNSFRGHAVGSDLVCLHPLRIPLQIPLRITHEIAKPHYS